MKTIKSSLLARPASGHESGLCYLKLFHGRRTKHEQPRDWGFEGPVIGPVGVSITYREIKVHAADWSDFDNLRFEEDLIAYDGMLYGDCEVLVQGDPVLAQLLKVGLEFHDFAAFRKASERGSNSTVKSASNRAKRRVKNEPVSGLLYAPNGKRISASKDWIPANAWIQSATRLPDGTFEIEWAGESRIGWDGQYTEERRGKRVFLDEADCEWTENQLSLKR